MGRPTFSAEAKGACRDQFTLSPCFTGRYSPNERKVNQDDHRPKNTCQTLSGLTVSNSYSFQVESRDARSVVRDLHGPGSRINPAIDPSGARIQRVLYQFSQGAGERGDVQIRTQLSNDGIR